MNHYIPNNFLLKFWAMREKRMTFHSALTQPFQAQGTTGRAEGQQETEIRTWFTDG